MEGRWVRLVLSAYYDRAIDFKDITDRNSKSLRKEAMILTEAENRLLRKLIEARCFMTTEQNKGWVPLMTRLIAPWLAETESVKSEEEKMLQLWKQHEIQKK